MSRCFGDGKPFLASGRIVHHDPFFLVRFQDNEMNHVPVQDSRDFRCVLNSYRRRDILRSGMGISRPSFWEDIAMKASLLFVAGLAIAISSIAPANAAPANPAPAAP